MVEAHTKDQGAPKLVLTDNERRNWALNDSSLWDQYASSDIYTRDYTTVRQWVSEHRQEIDRVIHDRLPGVFHKP